MPKLAFFDKSSNSINAHKGSAKTKKCQKSTSWRNCKNYLHQYDGEFVMTKGHGSIPTLASNSKLHFCNGLQMPEEASASESASEINTPAVLNNYSGKTRRSLAKTGFATRLV